MDYNNIYWTYIVQYADQFENVHELYEMQSETESVVSKNEIINKKDHHEYNVEVHQTFSRDIVLIIISLVCSSKYKVANIW